ncbi:MAG TPA: hypothetical protein PKJ92_02470, partial [Accumulibacter sp.]|nr:hypothetical protein [Accumulibacter sp.]
MAATKPPLVGGVGTPGAAIGDGDGTPGATSGAGSIAEIGERLRLWARRSGAGLARVEFIDETARRQVVAKLHRALADEAIALHEIGFDVLPVDAPTPPPAVGARLADELLARLRQLPPGVVSLDGLAAALPPAP